MNYNGLLGSADHTVVESLGVDDRVYSVYDVSRRIDDSGSVARAYAESRSARGVSSLYHSGAAGSEDGVRLPHDHVGEVERRNVDPADDALRSACCNCCLEDDLCSLTHILSLCL